MASFEGNFVGRLILPEATAGYYQFNQRREIHAMTEEMEDEITAPELDDDALEKRMRKLEDEVSRLLNHSNELLQTVNKERAKQEDIEVKDSTAGQE
jgi:predicted nuclease with TOPRIM domain